jgi:nitric oxide dioxygenase
MQYTVVHENVMASIAKVLGAAVTPEIAAAWSEAVLFLAKACIDTEESLYQMAEKRSGGWSGHIEFQVTEIKDVAEGIKSFSFKPPAGSPLTGQKFEFTPGQYLSLIVDPEQNGKTAPRHYTVTSPPGADFLQCTVKQIKGGKVSTFIHEKLRVGDTVKLAAPFGVFTVEATDGPAVLMSAGIGVTPMLNFKRSLGEKVKLSVHVDSTPGSFAYQSFFAESGPVLEKFTQTPGSKRPTAQALVAETLEKAGADNDFYLCGPESWMDDIQKELLKQGAKKVMCEVFGSQLATGCPFCAGR